MEFLSSYGDDNENSGNSLSDKKAEMSKGSANSSGDLQAEWESFEKMIGGGPVEDKEQYLQDGVVAYPGMSRARTVTESSGEQPKSALDKGSDVTFSFEVEEPQNISLPAEVSRSSRSRSASASSRSSSRSSKSRSSSASSSDDDSDQAPSKAKKTETDADQKSDDHKDEKTDVKRRPSRSTESPDKRKRSRSRSKSRSPVKKRRSRSRSRSRRKHSKRSHGRRGRSSSRSRRRRHRHSRSRSRDRRRRKHRRSSHDRSKDRRRRRKSRSRSRDRKKRSHHRRSRSRSRSKGRSRYSRSRSRSHERGGFRKSNSGSFSGMSSKDKPLTFKEQMRQQLLKASKFLQNGEHADGNEHILEIPKEKPSSLPLNNQTSILSAMAASVSSGVSSGVTPQMALLQTMAAMHQKAQEMTGVSVPKYYNPAAVNPLKYAEQVQKRKLLWSKNKEKDVEKDKDKEKEWQSTSFVSDSDGKQAAKFRKLMGIKEGEELPQDQESVPKNEEQLKKQQELFSRLDREYEFARMTTHTHRGVGLGFTSTQINPNT